MPAFSASEIDGARRRGHETGYRAGYAKGRADVIAEVVVALRAGAEAKREDACVQTAIGYIAAAHFIEREFGGQEHG